MTQWQNLILHCLLCFGTWCLFSVDLFSGQWAVFFAETILFTGDGYYLERRDWWRDVAV